MKSILEFLLDGTSILYRLFLAAICYQVAPELTKLLVIFYLANFGMTAYYLHLVNKEDRQFLNMIRDAIEKKSKETDETEIK